MRTFETRPLNLKETQKQLWRLIVAPEGIAAELRKNPCQVLPIQGDERLSNQKRLDIYANMYFYRILDVLKSDFPVLLKIIGEIPFHNLITSYLVRHPPTHWSLRFAGEKLPRFLKTHSLSKKHPYLSQLAQLEWVYVDVFDAPDAEVLREENLRSIPPDQWSDLSLQLIPAVQLLRFRYEIDAIRKEAMQGHLRKSYPVRPTILMVWRDGFKIFHRCVDPQEEGLLKQMRKRSNFARLCSDISRRRKNKNVASLISGYLRQWVQDGLLLKN